MYLKKPEKTYTGGIRNGFVGVSQTHLFCLCRFWFCGCSNGYSVSISNKTAGSEYNWPIVMCCTYCRFF